MKFHLITWGCCLLMLAAACTSEKKETNEKEGVETILPTMPNEVTVLPLKKQVFHHELISNGKVTAKEYADLYFRTSEVVAELFVKNGDRVRKGQPLAQLDLFKLDNTLAQRQTALDQAQLELKDVLIGQGYDPDRKDIPADVLKLAKVKSGYEQALANFEAARFEREQATLTAPFDGIVANLFDKKHNLAKTGEPFCRIIQTASMEVDFTVLENELPLLKVGDPVEVMPYAAQMGTCTGRLSEINPLVDEKGLVRVKARVDGGTRLFEGMNVKVSVKRAVPDQWVIPKTAVVLRSGKQVVFTLKGNQAMWNYVQTGLENLSDYTLVSWEGDGIQEGMEIIVTGNVNLAHEAPVKVIRTDQKE